MRFDFNGKGVLIAGASSGIGRVAALRMAKAGARVVITARRLEKLEDLVAEIAASGGVAFALCADLENIPATQDMVEKAARLLGRIDLAFLNAGGAPALDMRTVNAAQVTHYMRTNYDGVVNCLFPILDHMRNHGGGLVAHTNSLAGLLPVPLQGPYCAAKAAAKLLIDTCRLEFAEYGIRFVTVYPGFIATEATQDDGMPVPNELSEDQAVEHIMRAIGRGTAHYLFPRQTAMQVRLINALPSSWGEYILRRDVMHLAG